MSDATGRPLTEQERAVLRHLLSAPIEGAQALRDQVEAATAEGAWDDGDGPSLDLVVPASAPAAPLADGLVPVDAAVTGPDGEFAGELLLWLQDGRLAALEYAWVTDDAPTALPAVSEITVTAR
ncbi:hypothetical protein Cs7R123_60940 [Catellatospora sp. TT07R-123]|uniref:hypothetical protein n=1 Tax=Catellatospora sp. TT07R-123 TaxID=2733863 RepID=UPI001B046CB1|nr:hypothetical protein [Catellatospora sp. TT07R-123]GHJ48752.1 hypothetical protein Cs7R123_60940 [Catellatospora sp. TT07R-123]